MSLYENINRRRKLGISRSKEDSTISKGSYSNMKKGFPEKAKKGKLIEEDLVDVSYFGDKAMNKYNKYKFYCIYDPDFHLGNPLSPGCHFLCGHFVPPARYILRGIYLVNGTSLSIHIGGPPPGTSH